MPTPLYTTDVQKITDRTPKTALLDTDVFVVADEDGTLAPITKPNAKTTLGISDAESAISTLEGEIEDLQTAETEMKGTGWTDENLVDHESRIVVLENWTRVKSFLDVQEVVRAGRASAYFPIGLQLGADWNYTSRVWDVIGVNHDTPTDTNFTHSLTIQAHDILRSGRISGPEAMYNAVTELAAGTHIFTTNSLQYTFTSTKAVPAGGVIYIKTRSEYVPLALTIYADDRKTVIEDDIAVTATTGTDTITPINDHVRMRYGNNNYPISAIRQWLNSESATFTWQPLGLYDMPSSYETAGFIYLLDADLQAVIGAVDKQVALATYDGGGQELFSDKVFLLSRKEIFGSNEGVVTGEVVYPFWDGSSNADRIKGSPSDWWLRSPYVSNPRNTRVVDTSGVLGNGHAYGSHGLAPACVII
jgi:hypothetical protein